MKCSNCLARLPANSFKCVACGTNNDPKVRQVDPNLGKEAATGRSCPRCNVALRSIDIAVDGTFYVEHCDRCGGAFFDTGELERVLEVLTQQAEEVDRKQLNELAAGDYPQQSAQVRYLKCPVCRQLMNRKVFGARSGVVVDTCREHGTWLDGGELVRLIQWTNAGGPQLDAEKKDQEAKDAKRRRFRDTLMNQRGPDYRGGVI